MSTTSDAVSSETRAQQTLRRVAEGLEGGNVAGIAEIVKLVEALAANAVNISVQELAELIEKDVVVTAKVISAANTLGYNPSGVEVSSIQQAIQVIGFSKIRMLAMSLLLMENAERSHGADAQRETATLALTSGMLAQSWAEQQGKGNAEQAFLCASLRNFGRLLMAALLPDDDRQARLEAEQLGDPDAAYRTVFGLTPLELGYELLKSSNLPEPLLQGLRQFSPEVLDAAVLNPGDELLVISEFSVRISKLVLQPNLTPSQYAEQSQDLVRQFGKHLHLDAVVLKGMFERAEQRMSAFGQAFGLQTMSRSVTGRLSARRQGKPVPGAPSPAPAGAIPDGDTTSVAPVGGRASDQGTDSPSSAEAAGRRPGSVEPDSLETQAATPTELPPVRRPLIDVLNETVARCAEHLGQPVVREDQVAETIAKSLAAGWGADEIIILAERGKGSFACVAGAGSRWREFRQKTGFRRDERNVLGVAAARCEPVLIHDAADPKIDPYLPTWLKAGLGLYSCVIVPGGDAKASHSVLFAGWRVRQKLSLGTDELRSMRALLGMVLTARRLAGL